MLTTRSSFLRLLALAALSATCAMAGPTGTTITLTKTADTTWTEIDTYRWEISKTPQFPDQVTYVILPGDTAQIGFTVKAERYGPDVFISNTPVAGEVCVENTGSRATQNLYLVDQLEIFDEGDWVPAHPQFQIPTAGEISAGQRRCFNYSIEVSIDRTRLYRNRVTAAIDNYLGYEGTNHEIQKSADVNITVRTESIRPSTTVRDTFLCATGFECRSTWVDSFITNSQTFTYTESVKNIGALCGQTVTMTNNASLDFGSTIPASIPVGASATATVYSGSCRNDD